MKNCFKFIGIFLFLLFTSCVYPSKEYQYFYSHLQTFQLPRQSMREEDYFLIILVEACHLDYTNTSQFFQTVAIHPSNGSTRSDLGHAWIYLKGKGKNGTPFVLEGGHSGERQDVPVGYFEGIMNYNDWGYANPTEAQMCHPRYEPNPIKYLWTMRKDGFFQKGSGGHCPTFAAKISLSAQQFEEILSFIRPRHYPYQDYALMGPQCCTFVSQVAALAGLTLKAQMTMHIYPWLYYRNTRIRLWEDPRYSIMTFATPDIVEKNLMQAVKDGQAEYALDWYLERKDNSFSCQCTCP